MGRDAGVSVLPDRQLMYGIVKTADIDPVEQVDRFRDIAADRSDTDICNNAGSCCRGGRPSPIPACR